MTLLQNRINHKLRRNCEALVVSYEEEDNLNFDIAQKYGLSELILKRDDSQLPDYPQTVEIVSIQTNPKFREQGMATKVLNELIEWADMTGTALTGDPTDMFGMDLDRLFKFYERFGFVKKETTPYFYLRHAVVRLPHI